MPSERTQRQIDRLLGEAEGAMAQHDWQPLHQHAKDALLLDPESEDARNFLAAAQRALGSGATGHSAAATQPAPQVVSQAVEAEPAAFAGGRHTVKRFLGEGGKKTVCLAKDTVLDRDVAFALIKTEGLDEVGRERVLREGQAMGSLGSHPYIVTMFDLGEEADHPYMVTELMSGGDV